jgi:acyl dehydratase
VTEPLTHGTIHEVTAQPRVFSDLAEFVAAAGTELGTSGWHVANQEMVEQFAHLTGDPQWIHVDPERAKDGPYGATVVHGYFTLSMLVMMMNEVFRIENLAMGINYGLNKVRFPAPVRVGTPVRATVRLGDVTETANGTMATLVTSVEAEGNTKPACVAESVVLLAAAKKPVETA